MVLDTLVIRDEDCTGKLLNQFEIQLSTSVLTLRDVITERVFQEVEIYRAGTTALPYTLVSRETQAIYTIDYEQERFNALRGFAENGYLVLINDRQVESLDETLSLQNAATVTFIRLVPIVGG